MQQGSEKMNKKLRKTVISGVLCAMIFVLTMFVKIPIGAGYIHFADTLVYIGSALLGPWGMIAGALGEALADAVGGFAVYVPFTIIIKVLISLPFVLFSLKTEKLLTVKNVLFSVLAMLISVVGYAFADYIVAGQGMAIPYIWMNFVQGIASTACFAVFAAALDKIKIRNRIMR